MDKNELLQNIKENLTLDGKTFHIIKVMVSKSAEEKTLKSAKELEQDGKIKLEICQMSKINDTPAVDLKGYLV